MTKTKILNLENNLQFNHDFRKVDIMKISPTSGTVINLNKSGGDIKFQSLSSENCLDICEAYLYYEIEINVTSVEKEVTLENNWFPNLFANIRLRIANNDIEQINQPGIFSTMLNFVKLDKNYSEIIGFISDTKKGDVDNKGYKNRKKIYLSNQFQGYFPLNTLFGFLEGYRRVLYTCQIELILNRNKNDKLIFYGKQASVASLTLQTLELHIPELTLNPKSEISLLERLNTDKEIKVNYLNRITNVMDVQQGSTFSFTIGNLSYRP